MKEHSEKGWIKYGVPLDIQDFDSDKLKYLSSKFFNDFAVEAKKAINKNFDEPNLLSRNDIVHFDVGHGLSCFDIGSRLLFDCGSKTIGYSTYVDSIRSYLNAAGVNSKFSIVISHDHIDHHSFLIDLYNEFEDRIEFVYLSHIFNYLSLPSGLVDKFRRIDWGAYVSHGDVLIGAPNLVSFNHNLNSLIAVSNRDLLTGDQSYARIKEIIATMSISISSIGSIALPHHGRGTSGLPSTLGLDPGVDISFSDNKTAPSATEKRYYTTLPTKV